MKMYYTTQYFETVKQASRGKELKMNEELTRT